MKFLTNKAIWQKIIIVLVFIILFEFTFTSPVHADGTVLLNPIMNLFVSLGDGAMALIQNILLQQVEDGGDSLIKIQDNGGGFWSKVIVALVFIVGTTVAVISAIPSGGTSLALVAFAGKAIFAIAASGVAYAASYSILENFVEGMIGTTYYLPMYEVTPAEIFSDKVLLFDADFFNPKNDEPVVIEKNNVIPLTSSKLNRKDKEDKDISGLYQLSDSEFENFKKKYGFDENNFTNTENKINIREETLMGAGHLPEIELNEIEWKSSDGKTYKVYYSEGNYIKDLRCTSDNIETDMRYSTAGELQSTVASWYLALRNIALVALLSVLVYIGIRIMLSSIASDKAKYKQMLIDWIVAICLIFLMHYIMSFSVSISKKITEAFSSVTTTTEGTEEIKQKLNKVGGFENAELTKINEAVEIFVISDSDRAKDAWKRLVNNDDAKDAESNHYKQYFFTDSKLETHSSSESDANVLVWPANNAMEQARIKLQMLRGDGETKRQESYGYSIIFFVLIVYTIIFAFTYLKRVIYLAFLTIISPLVAITYPIDKMNDGQAQAFNMWLKEYIFNLLLQPLHLLLYIILIGSAMEFAARNVFYVVLALGFFVPAEKILRRFFGFEKAQTPGMFAGPAGAGLMMAGLKKIMNTRKPKNRLGTGKKENKEDNGKLSTYDDKTIDFNKPLDEISNNVKEGNKEKPKYFDKLSNEQIDELKADGIEPGSQEYNQYLRNHGINPTEKNTNVSPEKKNTQIPSHTAAKPVNKKNPEQEIKRKRSLRRGFKQGVRSYGKGMKNKLQQRYKAKGSLAKRGIRMAGGLYGATALAAAGGIVGITSGDLTKGMQYMAAGAAGGYKVGTAGVDKARNAVQVKDTMNNAKQAYYGDEYQKKQQEAYKKNLAKDEEFLQKLEKKFSLERKEAKQKAEQLAKYSDKKGIQSADDLIKLEALTKDGKHSIEDALKAIGYNNLALDGKNTNQLSSEDYNKYMQRYKERLLGNKENKIDERTAEASARKLFALMDEANKL